VLFDGDRTETLSVDEESGMVEENREFIAAIRDGRSPATGFRDGLRATSMILGAFESIRTGTPQTITIQEVH
jgi:predicted dehydrogenase